MTQEIKVFITSGYGGKVNVNVLMGGKTYIIDIDYLEEMLCEMIVEKGYTTQQTTRQKYPRLLINK